VLKTWGGRGEKKTHFEVLTPKDLEMLFKRLHKDSVGDTCMLHTEKSK
jgi:hypothetical protein